jgi:hypothetical protein
VRCIGLLSWAKAQVPETNKSSGSTRTAEARVLLFIKVLQFEIRLRRMETIGHLPGAFKR